MNREAESCANVDALLLDYAYDELVGAERAGVEGHLAECAKCRAELEAMAGTRRLMRVLEPEPAPETGLESLLAFAEKAAARQGAGAAAPSRWRWLVPALSAGGLALALVFVLSTTRAPRDLVVPAAAAPHGAKGAAASAAGLGEQRPVALAPGKPGPAAELSQREGAQAAPPAAPLVASVSQERVEKLGSGQGTTAKRRLGQRPRAQVLGDKEQAKADGAMGAGRGPPADAALVLEAEEAARGDDLDANEPHRPARPAPERSPRPESQAEASARKTAAPAAGKDSAPESWTAQPSQQRAAEKKLAGGSAKAELAPSTASRAGGSSSGRFDAELEAAAGLSRCGDHAGAARLLEKLLATVAPDDERAPAALLVFARELELAGEAAAAERAYARFVSLFPAHPSAQLAESGRARAQAALEAADGQSGTRGAGWPAAAPAEVHRSKLAPARSLEEAQGPLEQR